jgi:hypothetical protein
VNYNAQVAQNLTVGGNVNIIGGITAATLNITTGPNTIVGATTINNLLSSGVTITGGTIDGTTIGVTTPAAGNFTSIGATTQGTGAFTTGAFSGVVTITNATGTTTATPLTGALQVSGGISSGNNIAAAGTVASGATITLDGTTNPGTITETSAGGLNILSSNVNVAAGAGNFTVGVWGTPVFGVNATTGDMGNIGSAWLDNTAPGNQVTIGPGALGAASALTVNYNVAAGAGVGSIVTPGGVAAGSLWVTGNSTLATVTIGGGTIDNTVIGGTTPAAGTFTTVNATTGTFTNLLSGNVTITGGTIDGTAIGATTPAGGRFTSLEAVSSFKTSGSVFTAIAFTSVTPYPVASTDYVIVTNNNGAVNLPAIDATVHGRILIIRNVGANPINVNAAAGEFLLDQSNVASPSVSQVSGEAQTWLAFFNLGGVDYWMAISDNF